MYISHITHQKRIRGLIITQIFLFILNPFVSLCTCIYKLSSRRELARKEYNALYIFIALFWAVLAFTQKTDTGDISRVYEYAIRDSENIGGVVIGFRASLFSLINAYIYMITGNVQYISLLWIFLLYYLILKSILNIIEYKNKNLCGNQVYYLVTAMSCFMIFTQVTEIMKQAVVAGLFFYSFTSLINGRKRISVVAYLMSFGIHPTAFFYAPLYTAPFFKSKNVLVVLVIISFLFRVFNLMEFVMMVSQNIPFLSSINEIAEGYNEQHIENFFRSDSFYFAVSFIIYFATVMYAFIRDKENSILLRICMLMVIILNLNYSNSHNFTRMMLMLFPFYIIIYMELFKHVGIDSIVRRLFVILIGICSLYIQYGRLYGGGIYVTSFMDNSITKIVFSPLYYYLTTTI